MCKNYFLSLFCALLLLAGLPVSVVAQTSEVTIGENANKTDKVPVDYYNKNSHMQVIYLADELQELGGKMIESVTLYPTGSESKDLTPTSFKVYIGVTTKSSFSKTAGDAYVPLEEMELCYSGVFHHDFNTASPLKIILDDPFLYPALRLPDSSRLPDKGKGRPR